MHLEAGTRCETWTWIVKGVLRAAALPAASMYDLYDVYVLCTMYNRAIHKLQANDRCSCAVPHTHATNSSNLTNLVILSFSAFFGSNVLIAGIHVFIVYPWVSVLNSIFYSIFYFLYSIRCVLALCTLHILQILLLQFVLAWLCSLFSVQLLAVQLCNFLAPGTAHCSPHDDVNQANVLWRIEDWGMSAWIARVRACDVQCVTYDPRTLWPSRISNLDSRL